ncbi:hypothetical protein DOY81_011384 [Sarcophaga bullata]|nr:hypothetical protein DOY81_011384 [Sarcophaga bullata]
MWQWWKLMGLGEHWYAEEHFMLRENMDKFTKDSKYMEIFEGTKMFFMPVDYTRDIEFYNKESALSNLLISKHEVKIADKDFLAKQSSFSKLFIPC